MLCSLPTGKTHIHLEEGGGCAAGKLGGVETDLGLKLQGAEH